MPALDKCRTVGWKGFSQSTAAVCHEPVSAFTFPGISAAEDRVLAWPWASLLCETVPSAHVDPTTPGSKHTVGCSYEDGISS